MNPNWSYILITNLPPRLEQLWYAAKEVAVLHPYWIDYLKMRVANDALEAHLRKMMDLPTAKMSKRRPLCQNQPNSTQQ